MQRPPCSLLLALISLAASSLLPKTASCAQGEAHTPESSGLLAHYTFDKGRNKATLASSSPSLTTSSLQFEEASLAGISPIHEQAYFLLVNQAGATLPTTALEAEESPHNLSFVVDPAPNSKARGVPLPLTLRALTFDVGAASPKAGFDIRAFAVITIGSDIYREEATFSDSAQTTQASHSLSGAPSFSITKGGTRGLLPVQARISLAKLPSPLVEAAHIRLYLYIENLTGGPIPVGTNYSIRLDDLSLQGDGNR